MIEKLILRKIRESDCSQISEAFLQQGHEKTTTQYVQYLAYQKSGERDIIIAELEGKFAGYLTIKWKSDYLPFRELGIPEIVDFNVLQKFQRAGIGTQLMNEAENRIQKVANYAGIGFGVTEDYGAAQVLYFNRNYKPDGRGLVRDSKSIKLGEIITIDHSIVFHLTKKLV
ncbi:MAG: GNAT family N-acetyltransferase [Chitinophagales bacterium]